MVGRKRRGCSNREREHQPDQHRVPPVGLFAPSESGPSPPPRCYSPRSARTTALRSFSSPTRTSAYRAQASAVSFEHFGDVINRTARKTSGPLCITSRVNEPYIYVFFYRRIDPHLFLKTVHYKNPGAEFKHVSSFDRYTFGLDRCDPATTQGKAKPGRSTSRVSPPSRSAHTSSDCAVKHEVRQPKLAGN